MKKQFYTIILIFIFSVSNIFSQETFILNYIDDETSYGAMQLIEIEDNYILTFLESNQNSEVFKKITLTKTGEVIDEESYDNKFFLLKKEDNTFISLSIENESPDYSSFDLKICHLSQTFEELNSNSYHYNVNPANFIKIWIRTTIINSDNEIIVPVFIANEVPIINSNTVVFQISENLELISTKLFDESFDFYPIDIIQIPSDKSYLISSTNSYSFGSEIIRLDSLFNYITTFSYDKPNYLVFYPYFGHIKTFTDTTFLYNVVGRELHSFTEDKMKLILVDTAFNKLDSAMTGIAHHEHSDASDQGIDFIYKDAVYFGGSNADEIVDEYYYAVAKVNSDFNIEWERFIQYENPVFISGIYATQDSGCIVTDVEFGNTYMLHLIKFDKDGNYPTVGTNDIKVSELILYPNPATDFINIRLGSHLKDVTIEIYDITGKNIFIQKLENTETQINIADFNFGTYIYKCFDNERVIETGKFVKQ